MKQETYERFLNERRSLFIDALSLRWLHLVDLPGWRRPYVGISARYKLFKPEVDQTINQFNEAGAQVIQPEPGSLLLPTITPGFFPIGDEKYFDEVTIHNRFTRMMRVEDIHYFDNHDGTIGQTVGFELGVAQAIQDLFPYFVVAARKPIVLGNPFLNPYLSDVPVMSPKEAVQESMHQYSLWKKNIKEADLGSVEWDFVQNMKVAVNLGLSEHILRFMPWLKRN